MFDIQRLQLEQRDRMLDLQQNFAGLNPNGEEPTPANHLRIGPFSEQPPEHQRAPPEKQPNYVPCYPDGTPVLPGDPRASGSVSRTASLDHRFVYNSENTVHISTRITEQVSNRTLNRLPYDVKPTPIPIIVQRFDELLDGAMKSMTRSDDLNSIDYRLSEAESLAKLIISTHMV